MALPHCSEYPAICCRWPAVSEVARKAFSWRMRAMPTLYTAFFDSHMYGCPVARPMFYTFPDDQSAWNSNTQFMIGDSLLVAPCLQENGTSANVYFPRGTWYSLYDYSVTDASARATNKSIEVRIRQSPPWPSFVLVRGRFLLMHGLSVSQPINLLT